MKEVYFNSTKIKALFEKNNCANFEQIWALETPWFEKPNYRRNGWSGVIKYALTDKEGALTWVFIKRQENHNYKTFLHPFKGVPTFRREFHNIKKLNDKNVPTLRTLYYAERHNEGKDQAILITLSLEGYESLEAFCLNEDNKNKPQRQAIMMLAGQVTRQMHDAHFRHNCLYPKHFFIQQKPILDVRVIDLEKLKWFPFYYQIRRNDLSRIIRRGQPMTYDDKKILLNSYYQSGNGHLEKSALSEYLNQLLKSTLVIPNT